MQATADEQVIIDRKIDVKIALLEKSNQYTEDMLNRIEKKVDKVDVKVDKLETKIFNNFKWFLGISTGGLLSIASLGLAIYQYVKH